MYGLRDTIYALQDAGHALGVGHYGFLGTDDELLRLL